MKGSPVRVRASALRDLQALRRIQRKACSGLRVGIGDAAHLVRAAGEARSRPLALAVLPVEQGAFVEVVDWSRPALFESFGLPMSFPPSHRSNEDEVNEEE